MESVPLKTCTLCHEAKPLTAYYPHKSRKSGYLERCKPCHALSQRKRNPATPYAPGPHSGMAHPERFWAKVAKSDGCWEWTGAHMSGRYPYGSYRLAGEHHLAHRMAYELLRGPIPAGFVIDHLCRNPRCVRPDHLEIVTAEENIKRGVVYSNRLARTHCKHGHAYSPENTFYQRGARQCRTCHRERGREAARRRRARQRAAAA